MVAEAEAVEAAVETTESPLTVASEMISLVASFSCPTLGSHSLSAVAPDTDFRKELAEAA